MGRITVRDNLGINSVPWDLMGGGREEVPCTMENPVCTTNLTLRKERATYLFNKA